MKIRLSRKVENILKELKKSDPGAFTLVKKQLVLFETNPRHPLLRTHKLSGRLSGVYSISINRKLRLLYFIRNGEAWGYLIGTHDEVYKN